MKLKRAPAWRFFTGEDAQRLAVAAYYGASRWADFRAVEGERLTPGMFFDMFMSEFMATVRDDARTGPVCKPWMDEVQDAELSGTLDNRLDNLAQSRRNVKGLPPQENAPDNATVQGVENA